MMNLFRSIIKRIQEYLSKSPNLQKITDSVFWLALDKIIRLPVGLFVGAWLARYLAPEQFGIYASAIALSVLFRTFANLGLRRVVIRELIHQPEQKEAILGSAFGLLSVSGILSWGLSVLTAAWLYQDDSTSFWIVTIVGLRFVFCAFESIMYFFEAENQFRYIVIATIISYLFINALKVLFILLQADLMVFVGLFLAEMVLGLLGLAFIYHYKGYQLWNWTFSRRIATQLFKDGAPLIFSGMMVVVNARIDQVMLREMAGDAQAGVYAVSIQLLSILFFIPTIMHQAVFPNIVKEFANARPIFYQKLERIINLLYGLSYLVIITMFLFADIIIVLLFGEAYAEAAPAIRVLSILLIFSSMNVIKNSYLIIQNWTSLKLLFSVLAASINVIANLMLIPQYGIMGACYASLLSYGISVYFASWCFPKLYHLNRLITRALFLTRIRKWL